MRFSGFDDEWKSFKLSEISKRITRKNKSLETDRPLTISAQYGLVDQIEYFNKIVASKSLKGYYLLNKGEFAYNKSYSNGYPFGAVKRLDDYENGAISTLYICFNTNDKMNSDLLKEYFETDKWHEEIYKIAVEGARNHGLLNVAVGDFFNTKHVLPTNNHEQEKIAKFLIEINTKIDLLENKHKAYQDFKKYLMQKIFAQELRFADCTGEWNLFKLGDIVELMRNGCSENQVSFETEFPVTRIETISKGILNFDKMGYVEKIDSSYLLQYGDILLSNINSLKYIGNCVFFDEDKPLYHGMNLMLMRFKDDFNKKYLFYYMKFYQQWFQKMACQAVNQASINQSSLKKFPFYIPPTIDEQNKIVNVIDDTEHKINSIEDQIIKMEEFKKGLLQQMFVVQLILSLLQNKKHI